MFDNFYNALGSAADSVRDIEFFKIFIPLLAVIGPVLFFYFGLKGIVKRKTIVLGRNNITHTLRSGQINGIWAVITGFTYIFAGIVMVFILIPFAWALIFG